MNVHNRLSYLHILSMVALNNPKQNFNETKIAENKDLFNTIE